MTVWLLLVGWDYEGADVVGAYATREAAMAAAERCSHGNYRQVQGWRVDDDGGHSVMEWRSNRRPVE